MLHRTFGRVSYRALLSSVLGLIAACGSGPSESGDMGTGTEDMADGSPDMASGSPDAGSDAGVSGCPDGTEGCACNATTDENSLSLRRDDCEAGLECVDWGAFGRSESSLSRFDTDQVPAGSLQTCIRRCSTDDDCASGQACTSVFPLGSALVTDAFEPELRICADRVARDEEACSLSRLEGSGLLFDDDLDGILDVIDRREPGELVGCSEGLVCAMNFDQLMFTESEVPQVSPDEGVCLDLCDGDDDCAGDRPTCNFSFGFGSLGVCSDVAPSVGNVCEAASTVSGPNPITRVHRSCTLDGDLDGLVLCVRAGLAGTCTELCLDANGDGVLEPGIDVLCDIDRGFPRGCFVDSSGELGLCGQNCSGLNDDCGEGSTCRQINLGGGLVFPLCVDSLEPTFSVAEVDAFGAVTANGDDCSFGGLLQCPDNTSCLSGLGNGDATCVALCEFSATSTTVEAASTAFCEETFGNGSLCTDQTDLLGDDVGLCSTP
ncbi:MAG: hypothetical protein ACFB9M_16990 [Myxococcota bacterium]